MELELCLPRLNLSLKVVLVALLPLRCMMQQCR